MYEIPKWLKALYIISKILLTLLAVFIIVSIIFLNTAEYSGSDSEVLNGILTILIVFGGAVLFIKIITDPLLLTAFIAAVTAWFMYWKVRKEIERAGTSNWESRELAWLYCTIVGVSGMAVFFICCLIGG